MTNNGLVGCTVSSARAVRVECGGRQIGVVAGPLGVLARLFQGRASLQAFDFGNHARVQHLLGSGVVLFDAVQCRFAQHGCAPGQLGAKVERCTSSEASSSPTRVLSAWASWVRASAGLHCAALVAPPI